MKVKKLTQIALLCALICLLSPWTFPVGSLPITLGSMAVCLACAVCGMKGVIAAALYILLGMVGLPVFASFQGGVHMLVSPTAGYILGYIPMGLIVAAASAGKSSFCRLVLGQAFGYITLYAIGTAVYCITTNISPLSALTVTLLPFLLGDIFKIIFVGVITPRIRPHLR